MQVFVIRFTYYGRFNKLTEGSWLCVAKDEEEARHRWLEANSPGGSTLLSIQRYCSQEQLPL